MRPGPGKANGLKLRATHVDRCHSPASEKRSSMGSRRTIRVQRASRFLHVIDSHFAPHRPQIFQSGDEDSDGGYDSGFGLY
jgi:hypothetical protein